MCKEISFKDFEKNNYKVENSKYSLVGVCVECKNTYKYVSITNFMQTRITRPERKEFWNTCQQCRKTLTRNKFNKEKKEISYEILEKKEFKNENISTYAVSGKCLKCDNFYKYVCVDTFLRNRKNKLEKKELWNTCQKCWLLINTVNDPIWMKKNSDAQLIAQNKPEQKAKNAKAVSKSWTEERKIKNSEYLKKRWSEDEDFAKKAIKNIDWTGTKDGKFELLLRGSIGIGGLKGVYKNFCYDSALELSFIFWCENNNTKIKRYDLPGIAYLDENGKFREYFPDFIIEENIIVEIKGLGLYYEKNYERNLLKNEILKKWTVENDYSARIIFSNDPVLTKYYKLARKIHYENYPKKTDTLQGAC